MPISKADVSLSIFNLLKVGLEWKPNASVKKEARDFMRLLEAHKALYWQMNKEVVGSTAKSIRDLRIKLDAMNVDDEGLQEMIDLVRSACSRFQSIVERYGSFYGKKPDYIYGESIRYGNMNRTVENAFIEALEELRGTVRIVLLMAKRNGIKIPEPMVRELLGK